MSFGPNVGLERAEHRDGVSGHPVHQPVHGVRVGVHRHQEALLLPHQPGGVQRPLHVQRAHVYLPFTTLQEDPGAADAFARQPIFQARLRQGVYPLRLIEYRVNPGRRFFIADVAPEPAGQHQRPQIGPEAGHIIARQEGFRRRHWSAFCIIVSRSYC